MNLTTPLGVRRKRALFCATMLGGMFAAGAAAAAPALPTGGVVAAGTATIGAPSSSSLTVSQTSAKAIISWQGFSIGQGGTVQFNNGSGATLNRVTGTSVSSINGLLSATGSVYLINPNGVIISKTGVVNTGGTFVASTLDVANSSFLAGGPLTFSGPSTASIVNFGKVSSLGGSIAMIAATVENDGSITAQQGTVGLIAGTTVTMQDADNDDGGLFSVQVGDGSTSATNTGAISAAAVELRAQQGNVYALAGNTGGVINATGVDATGGVIKLISDAGTTTVAGALSAQGANGAAGQIETSGAVLQIGAASVDTHGGSWLLDPTNLIIDSTAASAIDGALLGGDVTLQTNASGPPTEAGVSGATGNTASGAGDLIVESAITWSTAHSLTLTAFHDLDIDAAITVLGPGALVLSGAGLNFGYSPSGFTGNIAFIDVVADATQGSLSINGQTYTLENNLAGLAQDIAADPSGHFALANSYNAQNDGSYTSAPIPTAFTGVFEGLGNSISNLTISANTAPADEGIGLFANVTTGDIADLAIVGGSLTGNANVGALAGSDGGNVSNVHSSMGVTGFGLVGGLIGEFGQPGSALTNSSSSGVITGMLVDASSSGEPEAIGGLVGQVDAGTVNASYATGLVAAAGGEQIGGLIGVTNANNNVVVSNSYATGEVAGGPDPSTFTAGSSVGGLIGDNGGAVINSYASGIVFGTQNVGGLIGFNENDAPGTDATNPTGDGTVVNSFATGAVFGYVDMFGNNGIDVGGLIGYSQGAVANAYASGTVLGGDQLGGLIGTNEGSLSNVYSTGAVVAAAGATPTELGGLVGEDDSGGDIQNAYWDTVTSGQPTVGVGSGAVAGVVGVTTAQLQSTATAGINLGGAFAGGAAAGEDGVYPYLASFFPTGVQAISGIAYADSGVTPDAPNQNAPQLVFIDIAGVQSVATTGANGYYYLALPNGALSAGGTPLLAYTLAGDLAGPVGAASLISATGTTAHLDVWGNLLIAPTISTTLSGAPATVTDLLAENGGADTALLSAAAGGDATATSGVPNLSLVGYIPTTASGFTIDQGITGEGLYVMTTAGPIAMAAPQTLGGPINFSLFSAGALSFQAPITVDTGALALNLAYGGGPTNFSFAVGAGVNYGTSDQGGALNVNGQSYTLLYAMSDLVGIDGGSGLVALATNLDASSTIYPGAVVGTFSGTFEGLGNTITGLTINGGANSDVGLIGTLNSTGTVSDLGLLGGTVSGTNDVGGLVGYNNGTVQASYATGAVSATGLVVGGLVGQNYGTVQTSHATGTVTGTSDVGGLIGVNGGASPGTVSDSYASGAVTGTGQWVGGLVGISESGSIGSTYATGAVMGSGYVGGLAGEVTGAGTVGTSYATGDVSGTSNVGGLVGSNAGGGSIVDGYYDADTTGQPAGLQGDGSEGLHTAALQGALPTGFSGTVWGTGAGLYPYLLNFFPNGVQAIVGSASSGGTPVAAGQVGVYAGGVLLGGGMVSAGANGYIYLAVAAGTLGASGDTIGAVLTDAGSSSPSGLVYTDAGGVASNVLTLPALNDGQNAQTTAELTYSGLQSDLAVTFGAPTYSALQIALSATPTTIAGSGVSFNVDQALSTVGLTIETNAGDPLSVTGAITLTGSGALGLTSGGALTIDAPIAVSGGGQVALSYAAGLSFGLGPSGFAGSLSYGVGSGEGILGQALTLNGTPYTLLYSMTDLANTNGAPGRFALAAPITSTGTLPNAVIADFVGTLEGLGDSISGLTINSAGNETALIGELDSGGVISDIGLSGGGVTGGLYDTGDLVGYNQGSISNAIVTGNVSAPGGIYVGGMVGLNSTGGRITNAIASGATVSASGGTSVGGLAGANYGSVATASASDTVTNGAGGFATGGLVGFNGAGATISANSSASGSVTGGGYDTGGLVGYNAGSIASASATGSVTAPGGLFVGGLVGVNEATGTIANATTSIGTVSASGGTGVGGLVGGNYGSVASSTASDTVTNGAGGFATGGLVGFNGAGATISANSSASGSVTGGGYDTGGLVGYNAGSIASASATGSVTAPGGLFVGGLVGVNEATGTIANATTSIGTVSASGGTGVGGLVGGNYGSVASSTASDTVTNGAGGFATGGLVGYNTSGATISANSSASGSVTGGGYDTGGLVGYNAGSIASASATGSVTAPGGLFVGGLVGVNEATGTVGSDTTSGGTVSASGGTGVGGLVGGNYGSVASSTASDTVTNGADGYATGGLVGYNGSGATISGMSSASGAVTGGAYDTGGLVGYNAGGIASARASGSVTTSGGSFIGGLVGYNAAGGTIALSIASGATVSAGDGSAVGGLVGANYGSVSQSAATDAVSNGADGFATGGLVGYNVGSITDAYATGAVTGVGVTGGLAGYNSGAIATSWSSSAVVGDWVFGGSVGEQAAGGSFTNVYWDEGTSGLTDGVGSGSSAGLSGIGGATGLDPHAQATYAGFNFVATWTINAGVSRAFLQNVTPQTPPN